MFGKSFCIMVRLVNSFLPNVQQRFSGVFREYKIGTLAGNGLNASQSGYFNFFEVNLFCRSSHREHGAKSEVGRS